MAETIDIRELNERIERQKFFCYQPYCWYGPDHRRTKTSGRVIVNRFAV